MKSFVTVSIPLRSDFNKDMMKIHANLEMVSIPLRSDFNKPSDIDEKASLVVSIPLRSDFNPNISRPFVREESGFNPSKV